MTESVVLKLSYAGQCHHMTVPLCSANPKNDLSYELVLAKVQETYPRLTGWTLVYRDDEDDIVTVSHTFEFDEACHTLFAMASHDHDELRTLHFSVLKRVTLREKLVAPVLQTLMDLACLAREAATYMRNGELIGKGRTSFVTLATQASETISQIRNSKVVGRGRTSLGNSAAHTRTLLLSARTGVSTQLRRASSAVVAGIDRRRSSSSSASDLDPQDAFKSCISLISPSVDTPVTVDLRPSVSASFEATAEENDEELPALTRASAADDELVSGTVYESDTDTLCDDDDREWDIVNTAAGKDALVEIDGVWSYQLHVIRGILGQVDEEVCCDLLSHYDGDVEAVLVELTNA